MEFFQREVCGLLDVVLPQPRLTLTLPPGMRATLVNPFPSWHDGCCLTVDLRDMAALDTLTLVFDVMTQPGEISPIDPPSVKVGLHHDPDTGPRVDATFESLRRVEVRELAGMPSNTDVQVQAARLRADRHHREAMRLDREGRVDEAREIFNRAMRTLDAAPPTEDIVAERKEAMLLFESVGNLSENARKDRVFRAMYRSRGHLSP